MEIQLPQLLIDELKLQGILTPELEEETKREAWEQSIDYGELLISKNIVKDSNLLQIKAKVYNLPIIDAQNISIPKELSENVSENMISFYKVLPFERIENILKVAIINPENISALEALKFMASEKDVQFEKYLISYNDFNGLSKGLKTLGTEIGRALESMGGEKKGGVDLELEAEDTKLENISAEAPITKVVASLVKHAVDTGASDIHVEALDDDIRMRYRIDGVLQTVLTLPIKLLSALVTRIKILADLKIDETRLAQDGRFSTNMNNRQIDFRVSTFPTRDGEKVVMRILDPFVGNIQMSDLGIQGRSEKLLLKNMDKPFGAILITGPTGSGKSTTLAALLRHMNSDEVNIVTLEDPIEYYVVGVNQSQVHEEIGYTFASGLRHILRQDPDIIMVGEVRDAETAKLAVQASLTGHILLSTLHTNDTIGVIPRLIDMEVEKYLIAPTLNLAIAQRLLRRLCSSCKIQAEPSESERNMIEVALKDISQEEKSRVPNDYSQFFQPGKGCKDCGQKAYRGRIGIYESLEMTDELERVILADISEEKLRVEAKRQGMITMYQDGILKVLQGMTSIEELMQVAQSATKSQSEDNVIDVSKK